MHSMAKFVDEFTLKSLVIEVSISKPNKTLESVDHNNENSNP